MRASARKSRAFTLVEILIVVVILGILAAIVIPQFTNASQEATASSLRSQLQTIRSQIELFRVRNNGSLPTLVADQWDPLVDDDYLQAAPVNSLTGTSTVAAADGAGVAWVYDNATGEIFATNPDNIDFDGDGAGDGSPLPW